MWMEGRKREVLLSNMTHVTWGGDTRETLRPFSPLLEISHELSNKRASRELCELFTRYRADGSCSYSRDLEIFDSMVAHIEYSACIVVFQLCGVTWLCGSIYQLKNFHHSGWGLQSNVASQTNSHYLYIGPKVHIFESVKGSDVKQYINSSSNAKRWTRSRFPTALLCHHINTSTLLNRESLHILATRPMKATIYTEMPKAFWTPCWNDA